MIRISAMIIGTLTESKTRMPSMTLVLVSDVSWLAASCRYRLPLDVWCVAADLAQPTPAGDIDPTLIKEGAAAPNSGQEEDDDEVVDSKPPLTRQAGQRKLLQVNAQPQQKTFSTSTTTPRVSVVAGSAASKAGTGAAAAVDVVRAAA